MNKNTRLIMVGGFLGAGKTTLLKETTGHLMREGMRVGLITNDQAPQLVDTALLLQTRARVAEVSGSCFCCNYNGFIDSLKKVKGESEADIILAEPVGSCTDLSATIMQPLKEKMNRELIISPLSVLADPQRLEEILDGGTGGLHPSAAYIFEKQLEESDIILISKTDLLEPEGLELLVRKVTERYPDSKVLPVSAKTGEGIAQWLHALSESTGAGTRIIDVDYDIYAEGEAVLGWLNSSVTLKGKQVNWDELVSTFINELGCRFDALHIAVGHMKVVLISGNNTITGNITGNVETAQVRGSAGVSGEARMIINARVGTTPEKLDQLMREALETMKNREIRIETDAWKSLSPGYPNPTHRYTRVIDSLK